MPEQQTLEITCVNCSNLSSDVRYPLFFGPERRFVCNECLDANVFLCPSCDTYINRTVGNARVTDLVVPEHGWMLGWVVASDTDEYLCNNCAYTCSVCTSRFEFEDNAQECCPDYRQVHSYSFRPGYTFFRTISSNSAARDFSPKPGLLYMGFEIELERARNYVAEFYNKSGESFESPRFMYLKEDGSLSDDGVEFVTMPATLEAFELLFPWETFDMLHKKGVRGWAMNSCGTHIHVSRSAFSPSHLYKFMKFQLMNDTFCIAYAGRESNFAQWMNGSMEDMRNYPSKYVKHGDAYNDRYSAINALNRNTIELRYFRSNITKDGIMRNAQWVDAIFNYTKTMDIRGPRLNRWNYEPFVEFVNNQPKYSLVSEYIERVWE